MLLLFSQTLILLVGMLAGFSVEVRGHGGRREVNPYWAHRKAICSHRKPIS